MWSAKIKKNPTVSKRTKYLRHGLRTGASRKRGYAFLEEIRYSVSTANEWFLRMESARQA